MVTRIDELTPEQRGKMAPWADMWIRRGLSCEPINLDNFERGVRACYKYAGIEGIPHIVAAGNPAVCVLAGSAAAWLLSGGTPSPSGKTPKLPFWEEIVEVVYGAISPYLPLSSLEIEEKLQGRGVAPFEGWTSYIGGSWWLSWQAYESFFREVCQLELDTHEKAEAYALAQQNAGWWWPHEKFVVVSDRPAEIKLEQVRSRGADFYRLHSRQGPALRYRDGFSLFWIHGMSLPGEKVMNPEKISCQEISSTKNIELRRILMTQYGPEISGPREDEYDGTEKYLTDFLTKERGGN